MQQIFFIGLAGMLGTIARYGLSELINKRFNGPFPTGTFLVNVIGCFFAGFLFYVVQEKMALTETVRLALMVGFLGGFTTFSAFGLQTFVLARDGQLLVGTLNVLVSNLAGVLAVWLGFVVGRLVAA